MTLATNDIENAAKKVDLAKDAENKAYWMGLNHGSSDNKKLEQELEALKQKALNRLIEIEGLRKENNTLKQTINGLLDLDDPRLRKIATLEAENATLRSRYET